MQREFGYSLLGGLWKGRGRGRGREKETEREWGEVREERKKAAPSSEEELRKRERACRVEEDPLAPVEESGRGLSLKGSGYPGDETDHYISISFLQEKGRKFGTTG